MFLLFALNCCLYRGARWPQYKVIVRGLWIILCVTGYKAGFCWGMQQSVIFLQFNYCRCSVTPYNAPPSTRRM
ncbi:hypothetical protein DA718_27755 [Klebsiella huaxiensis]|nr:hypothetical protein DA718_27755 [Klebsiella huaxiensis]